MKLLAIRLSQQAGKSLVIAMTNLKAPVVTKYLGFDNKQIWNGRLDNIHLKNTKVVLQNIKIAQGYADLFGFVVPAPDTLIRVQAATGTQLDKVAGSTPDETTKY